MSGAVLINKDNFAAIKLSSRIQAIAKPLELLGITFFNHQRVFKDFSRIFLSTHPEWAKHFFDHAYYNQGRFSSHPFDFKNNAALLWKTFPADRVCTDASENFNIDNGITLIRSHKDYQDLYLFASTRENYSINGFYLANLDLLNHFIDFYIEKTSGLLKQCVPDQPSITPHIINCDDENHLPRSISPETLEDFLKSIETRYYYVMHKEQEVRLSRNEYFCGKLMVEGKTIKEIANILNLQQGTCYRHVENLKNKLNIYSTPSLVAAFKKMIPSFSQPVL